MVSRRVDGVSERKVPAVRRWSRQSARGEQPQPQGTGSRPALPIDTVSNASTRATEEDVRLHAADRILISTQHSNAIVEVEADPAGADHAIVEIHRGDSADRKSVVMVPSDRSIDHSPQEGITLRTVAPDLADLI